MNMYERQSTSCGSEIAVKDFAVFKFGQGHKHYGLYKVKALGNRRTTF